MKCANNESEVFLDFLISPSNSNQYFQLRSFFIYRLTNNTNNQIEKLFTKV